MQDILQKRAEKLAMSLDDSEGRGERLPIVDFILGNQRYAVDAYQVKEVCPLIDITPLPDTPSFLVGVINNRRQIIPVFDLKQILSIKEVSKPQKILIVESSDSSLAFLIDEVLSTREVLLSYPFTGWCYQRIEGDGLALI